METLWQIGKLAAGVYIGLGLVLFIFQSHLLFYPNYPSRELSYTPTDIGLEFESVDLKTEDAVRLHGWYLPAVDRKGVILFFHGNAGNISHRLDSLRIFHHLGYSSLIIDYRGYGRSEGKISEQGSYRDAEAAWRYLVHERGIAENEIVYFGRSLGASVAAWLATHHTPRGIILESAFTSVPDFAATIYPVYPTRLLSRYSYDTRTYIKQVGSPVLVVHSEQDEIIPYSQGKQLYASANEPKRMLTIRGGHNDGFIVSGMDYLNGLSAFLDSMDRTQ